MCEYCHQLHCPPGCPNYAPRMSGLTCEECGEPIPVGAVYWDVDGACVCDDCLKTISVFDLLDRKGMTYSDLLELLDIRQMEAEESSEGIDRRGERC